MAILGSRAWGLPVGDQGGGHRSCPRGEVFISSEEAHTASQGGSPLRQAGATLGTGLSVGLQRGTQHAVPGPTGRGQRRRSACRTGGPHTMALGEGPGAVCQNSAELPGSLGRFLGPLCLADSWWEGRGNRDSA